MFIKGGSIELISKVKLPSQSVYQSDATDMSPAYIIEHDLVIIVDRIC